MKKLSTKTVDYMGAFWFQNWERVDMIRLAHQKGKHELVAKYLVNSGAVEPITEEDREIIEVAKSMTTGEMLEQESRALIGARIYSCNSCEEHFYEDVRVGLTVPDNCPCCLENLQVEGALDDHSKNSA